MPFVLDASTALSLILEDEKSVFVSTAALATLDAKLVEAAQMEDVEILQPTAKLN